MCPLKGTLREFDFRSLLQLLELGQYSGQLFVEVHRSSLAQTENRTRLTNGDTSNSASPVPGQPAESMWHFWLANGQIAYAAAAQDNTCSLQRLRDYLRRYRAENALERLLAQSISLTISSSLEYESLWLLFQERVLTATQVRNITYQLISEPFFDLLNLRQGSFIFKPGLIFDSLITTWEISPLASELMQQLQQWQQFYPQIHSPHQYLVITQKAPLKSALTPNAYRNLSLACNQKLSLRRLARYLNRNLLTTAKALYPYVQRGWIQLATPQSPSSLAQPLTPSSAGSSSGGYFEQVQSQFSQTSHPPHVVCIDNDVTVCQEVEYILKQHGYRTTSMAEPSRAMDFIFQHQPDAILCPLILPTLSGLDLCTLLRSTVAFRETPIILFLNHTDDPSALMRAQMAEATEYLSKPIEPIEVLRVLEKYLGSDRLPIG